LPLILFQGKVLGSLLKLEYFMRRCDLTGKRPLTGRSICRRGLAKKTGGVGIKTTAINARKFYPNLHDRRLYVPELKRYVQVRVSASGLRTAKKRGIYKTLVEAGVIKAL
jgi:large subunit ribosomal protein L28